MNKTNVPNIFTLARIQQRKQNICLPSLLIYHHWWNNQYKTFWRHHDLTNSSFDLCIKLLSYTILFLVNLFNGYVKTLNDNKRKGHGRIFIIRDTASYSPHKKDHKQKTRNVVSRCHMTEAFFRGVL